MDGIAPNTKDKPKQPTTKKGQILAFFDTGIRDVDELARLTQSRPSYVASVLQQQGLISGYFDLYTSTANLMNVYSRFFVGQLGFRTLAAARRSVAHIDRLYHQFEHEGDRAGQHHALVMAMVMYNRARWTNKTKEAEVFRTWLIEQLARPLDTESNVQQLHLAYPPVAA